MKILNERPAGMELNEYHAKQKKFKTWLKAYKKGGFVYLTRRLSEQKSNGVVQPVIMRYPSFIGKGKVKELNYV